MNCKLFNRILCVAVAAATCAVAVASPSGDRKRGKNRKQRVAVVVDGTTSDATSTEAVMREVTVTDARAQLAGTWVVTDVRRKPLKAGLRTRLDFDIKNGRLTGELACNLVNARLKTNNASITFSDVVTTHHSCDDAASEQSIVKALNESRTLRMETNGRVTVLHTLSSHGSTVLSLRRVDLAAIDGAWQLLSLRGENVPAGSVRMVLDATAAMFHAVGDHIINGVTRVDAATDHSLQFEDLHTTDDDIELSPVESQLTLALEEVTGYDVDRQGVMSLHDEEGRVVATLKRL